MNSHQYEFDAKWITRQLGFLALFLVAGSLLLRISTSILPRSRNTWDMDRTIMAHQADASMAGGDADILLIGDSSCLMNIDASLLSAQLGVKVLNLGTVSFLNIETFAKLLETYFESSSKHPSAVVLVTHPDFLRRSSPSRSHVTWMEHYFAGRDDFSRKRTWKSIDQWLGAHIFQGRILKFLPRPLSVEFGNQFGFTRDLEIYMSEHGGSALDPRTLDPKKLTGSREYRISTPNKKAANDFSQSIPKDVKLYVAFSPLPDSFVNPNLSEDLNQLRAEWTSALKAERALDTLPFSMPNEHFASKTHLAPSAVEPYSKNLATALK